METIIDKFVMENKPATIKIIGVGGGGGNAVDNMVRAGIEGVSYLLVNTDSAALEASLVPNRIQIGTGLGAGNNPDVARSAAEDSKDAISKALDDGTHMVFITAGMGGGTGTGAASVVAKIAKEKKLLTIGIVTVPFRFEGEVKMNKALDGVEKMIPEVDSIIVINNQLLTDEAETPIYECFRMADDVLVSAAKSIADIITHKGYMNVDFADVEATLKSSKMAVINTGEAEGENRVAKAIDAAVHSHLLDNSNITKAKKLLFYFYGSTKNGIMGKEVTEIQEFVEGMENPQDVIWGYCTDDDCGDKVRVTLLAAIDEELDRNKYLNPKSDGMPISVLKQKFGDKLPDLDVFDDDDTKLTDMTDIDALQRTRIYKF